MALIATPGTAPGSARRTQAASARPASSKPQYLLGECPTYAGAETIVDLLSDKGFPVEHARIVGHGLTSVEYVTGRLTNARAALAGAATGAWLGLFVGLVLSLFSTTDTNWLGLILSSAGIGAAWLAAFGFLAQWATRGRRDFASVRGIEAEGYAVYTDLDLSDEALRIIEVGRR